MMVTPLRDFVAERVRARWTEWSREHPHLAAAIDQTRLVESAVTQLRDDAQFADAMRQADLDEATLAAAAKVLAEAERVVGRVLP